MAISQRTLEEQFFATDRTELDRALWNRFIREVGVRLRALDRIVIDWERVSQQGIQVALDRINEVLLPASVRIREVAELGFLVATSTSERTLVAGETVSFIIDEDRRDLFTPGPFLAVTRLSTPDDYAVGRLMYLNRETGVLDVQIEAVFGDPGPHDDWQFSAVAGAVQAQVQILADVQGIKGEIEGMLSAVVGHKEEVTTLRGQTLELRNETQTFRNTAGGHATSAGEAAGAAADSATAAFNHKEAAEAAATGTVRHDIAQSLNGTARIQVLNNLGLDLDQDNRIINGDFGIWQRGTSHTTGGYGSVDRWRQFIQGGGTVGMSRQAFGLGDTIGGNLSKYYLRKSVSGQSGASAVYLATHPIEDVRSYAGQTITVLGWVRRSAGSGNVFLEFDQRFGTGGAPSSSVLTQGGLVTLSSDWAPFAVTINVPSISGKTLGTNGDSSLELNTWLSSGSDFNARTNSLGIQDITVDFWGLHIRRGVWPASAAALYRPRHPAVDLAMCQRYYERFGQDGSGMVTSATSVDMAFSYSAKRAVPDISLVGTGQSQITEPSVATRQVTAINAIQARGRTNGCLLSLGVSGGGMTFRNLVVAYPVNFPDGFLAADAEL